MDNFKIAEEKGRRKFKQDLDRHNATYEFTEDKYDNIDCFVTGNNKTFAVEIKNRDILMDTYDTYILELTKYKALMDAYENSGYTPTYVNYFQDGRMVWVLNELNITPDRISTKWCTATTAENYGHRRQKQVIMLSPTETYGHN